MGKHSRNRDYKNQLKGWGAAGFEPGLSFPPFVSDSGYSEEIAPASDDMEYAPSSYSSIERTDGWRTKAFKAAAEAFYMEKTPLGIRIDFSQAPSQDRKKHCALIAIRTLKRTWEISRLTNASPIDKDGRPINESDWEKTVVAQASRNISNGEMRLLMQAWEWYVDQHYQNHYMATESSDTEYVCSVPKNAAPNTKYIRDEREEPQIAFAATAAMA